MIKLFAESCMRVFFVIITFFGLSCQLNAAEKAVLSRVLADISGAGSSHSSYQILKTEHFKVVHCISTDEAKKIEGVLEFSYSQFQSVFGGYGLKTYCPRDELLWICFNDTDSFNNYALSTEEMDLSWLSGYYSSKTNAVVVLKPGKTIKGENTGNRAVDVMAWANNTADVGLVKIIHEAAHQLSFNTGLQKRGVMYPLWAGEGPCADF